MTEWKQNRVRALLLAGAMVIAVCGCQSMRKQAWRQDGAITGKSPGWTFTPSENTGKMTFYPDEGYYLDRGGKLQGAMIPLPDGQFKFFRYTFDSKSPILCYWNLDFVDVNGIRIPGDDYSAIYPSNERVRNNCVFYGRPGMRGVEPLFQSLEALSLWDLRIEEISPTAAARWCDELYQTLPPLVYSPEPGRLAHLPKTMAALKNGTPWRMLILGHSLFNDTFNSNFSALLKRRYPKSRLDVLWSGRGSTGCEHYQDHVKEYIADYRPDVVIIGGVAKDQDIRPIASVVAQIRAGIGCEIILMTEPFGWDIRKHQADDRVTPLPPQTIDADAFFKNLDPQQPLAIGPLAFAAIQRDFAAHEKIAFLDAKTVWYDYLGNSGKPWGWFNRDIVHVNDRGKQVVARILERFFDERVNP